MAELFTDRYGHSRAFSQSQQQWIFQAPDSLTGTCVNSTIAVRLPTNHLPTSTSHIFLSSASRESLKKPFTGRYKDCSGSLKSGFLEVSNPSVRADMF